MKPLAILAGAFMAAGGSVPPDATPRGLDPRNQGHIWIVEQEAGRVLEVHRKRGVIRQQGGFDRPRDVEVLPNGHIVVAGLDGKAIEVDLKGSEAWKYEGKEGIYAVRHLRGGNILAATHKRLIEVNREALVVWEFPIPGCPGDLAILPKGNYLLAIYGGSKVMEISKEGGEIRCRSIPNRPMSVQCLADGNILTAEVALNRVSEWDPNEKLIREFQTGTNCPSAYRTRRGTTLVSTWDRVYEIDGGGKTVWESPPVNRCIRAREF